jgi:hypothetical protein
MIRAAARVLAAALAEVGMSDYRRLSDAIDPLRLPPLRARARPVPGDRRPGFRYCACCASPLDRAPVMRGMWAYCSIECALKMERADAEESA